MADKQDEKIEELVDKRVQELRKEFEQEKKQIRKEAQKEIKQVKKEVQKLKTNSNPTNASRSKNKSNNISRRQFLKKAGLGTAGLAALMSPISALDIRSDSFNVVTDSGNTQYFSIEETGPVNILNTDLDLNSNDLLNASGILTESIDVSSGLKIPSLEAGSEDAENRQIWINQEGDEIKIKISDKIYRLESVDLDFISPNAVLHYPLIERSDSEIEESIAGEHGSDEGSENLSGSTYYQGYAEERNGGHIELTTFENVGWSVDENFTFYATVSTNSSDATVFGARSSDVMASLFLGEGRVSGGGAKSGSIGIGIRDSEGNDVGIETVSTNYDDGGLYRIAARKAGNNPTDMDIFINGQHVDTEVTSDQEYSVGNSIDIPFYAFEGNGSFGSALNGVIDNLVISESADSSSIIKEDYEAQQFN